ncbi:hypothetical protein M440DRAFT_1387874 [Trichoderma longibrachiatum ATCC 18648]|uniref:Vacuolar membrane protein n=1 Tax=Trichoderma longibrachiatum ATCC 18648 TaxID=983965 RepID=A0A2T4CIS9_TRILO|nr:hypothetical protein M440DRAFT_1387874 [Trichoderma longibrachiatum ATCC 18648]
MATLATTASSALASATASATASPSGPFHIDASQGECQLLGPFALVVQAALGGLAMLSLVYKRWREHPRRPVKVWFFDVSKQVFGSVLVHISNIFMSMLTSGRFSIKPAESIKSGYYGNPPNVWWWLKQSVIYFAGLFGMKLCVLVIFIMMPWISQVGDWALRWTEGNEKLQVAFVMMIFPLIMNALQYYIIDSFIKGKEMDHELLPSEDNDDDDDDYERRGTGSGGIGSDQDETPIKYNGRARNGDEEYDPDVDGDAPTIHGSSSSRPGSKPSGVSVDLFPKE